MSNCRLILASQTHPTKPHWSDDNGREECWLKLGGAVADWMDPMDEKDWYDVDNIRDTEN